MAIEAWRDPELKRQAQQRIEELYTLVREEFNPEATYGYEVDDLFLMLGWCSLDIEADRISFKNPKTGATFGVYSEFNFRRGGFAKVRKHSPELPEAELDKIDHAIAIETTRVFDKLGISYDNPAEG